MNQEGLVSAEGGGRVRGWGCCLGRPDEQACIGGHLTPSRNLDHFDHLREAA